MVTKQDLIRSKLQSKVFTPYGKSVTFINKSSITYNTRGEETGYTASSASGTVVPYNLIDKEQAHESFGNIDNGESDFAVPYNTSVDVDTTFEMEGDTYVVKRIEKNYLPGNVVTIIRAVKQLA